MDFNKSTLPKEPRSKKNKILFFAAIGAAVAVAIGIILFVIHANMLH